MKCAHCGNEMHDGFIPILRGRLYWLPEDQDVPWMVVKHPKKGIILSDYTLMSPKKADAYYCETCKVVTIPVKDDK